MNRYARNIACEGIGENGQKRIASSSVFIVGCGALGSSVAMMLAGAGVGNIAIADFDTIDISNLQRQLFFTESEAGSSKAEALGKRMEALNSEVKVQVFNQLVTKDMAKEIFAKYDFIIDGSDNPATKYNTDSVCREIGKPCCIGGVSGWSFQVMTVVGESVRYSDVFPPGVDGAIMPCAINGVMGPTAMMCAAAMSQETLKYLTGAGELLTNRLLHIDTLSFQPTIISL